MTGCRGLSSISGQSSTGRGRHLYDPIEVINRRLSPDLPARDLRFALINLISRLLGRAISAPDNPEKQQQGQPGGSAPSLPEGRRLYCIGDIHGRLDLLEELHEMILADAAEYDGSKAVVYLGDYIDRGSQSAQVLDLLIAQTLDGFETIHLAGNHEQSMLEFLVNPWETAAWLTYGGRLALLSYGIGPGKLMRREDIEGLRDQLQEKLPQSHLDFLRSCPLLHTEGDYCFVHAGIRPGVPLEEQDESDLLWIRDEFTQSQVKHDHVVVHGHTISEEVEWLPNRIGIDTGAYVTGVLTALVLEGTERRLLQTGRVVT
ncbi:MAG: serine/threonine protein phosphatase [Xanthomonadales bacterium]|nr:serine/threonine protein phosphatase [Gammaproteobacteria bacterium]NNK04394.1 serine/threonine protein phosphatase [Xanthomonadales bacterium]